MRTTIPIVLSCLVATTVGCDPDDPCDPDQIHDRGTCADSAMDAGPGDAGEYAGFGNPCTDPMRTDECTTGNADTCAPVPGGDTYCTALGCVMDASVCPPGWLCLDPSVDPRVPPEGICLDL